MLEPLTDAALVAAALTTGLVAGLFYAFSISVMPGLRRTDDRAFVNAMQHINVAILNGWFALCFAGAPVLTVVAALSHLGEGTMLGWIAGALVLYAMMSAITFGVNVPLNNELATAGDPGAARKRFESRWVRWNHARTLCATASFGCLAGAVLLH